MTKIKKLYKEIKNKIKENNKTTVTVYFTLRVLVILCMIREFLRGDWNNAFLCLLSLILFLMPFFVEKKFKIDLPSTLEIIILLFIFSAEILGEINNFYGKIPYWDTILHTLNGFLCAGVGFALFDLLNNNVESINLSPFFLSLIAFCFSMTIGVLWEFFEYHADIYLKTDMQKDRIVGELSSVLINSEKENEAIKIDDIEYSIIYSIDENGKRIETKIENGYLDIGLHDTMKDMFVNFIGALVFSIVGYQYIYNRDRYGFVTHFVPTKKSS